MIEWMVEVHRALRSIRKKCQNAFDRLAVDDKADCSEVQGYAKEDLDRFRTLWTRGGGTDAQLSDLIRHIGYFTKTDIGDILRRDIAAVEDIAEKMALAAPTLPSESGAIISLLHPVILEHAYPHLRSGYLKDAVFNGVLAVFEMIRQKSGLGFDGFELVNAVFSPKNPMFVFSEIETESGQNEQNGYYKIFLGVFEGIRNPKAHRLTHDLTPTLAAQHLVQLSLLARKVADAVKNEAYVAPQPKP